MLLHIVNNSSHEKDTACEPCHKENAFTVWKVGFNKHKKFLPDSIRLRFGKILRHNKKWKSNRNKSLGTWNVLYVRIRHECFRDVGIFEGSSFFDMEKWNKNWIKKNHMWNLQEQNHFKHIVNFPDIKSVKMILFYHTKLK